MEREEAEAMMRSFPKAPNIWAAFILIFVFALSGCAGHRAEPYFIRVTLVRSEFYSPAEGSPASIRIQPNEDAVFRVAVRSGYYIADAGYEGAELKEGEDGTVTLLLPAVKYSLRVALTCRELPTASGPTGSDPEDDPFNQVEHAGAIRYYANGGSYFHSEYSYEREIVLNGHVRPNTDIGTDQIYRDGHTLLCWNTAPDGSGTSYGLGSRCDLPERGQLRLYAQWETWTPAAEFRISVTDGSACIEGYDGSADRICVPEQALGVPVTKIAQGAFADRRISALILPKTLERVEDGAFGGASVEDLTFFDNLQYISDRAFLGSPHLPTVHINAILAPRFSKLDRHSNYTDKIDLLKAHEHDKKLIVFGGSGAFFSVDSSMIYEAFGGEYEVVNMAINAWFPATAQTDIILHYVREGDIFLHLPEMASPAQLFCENLFALPSESDPDGYDDRYMSVFESNYDALSFVDLDDAPGVLDSFTRYNAERADMREGSYSDNPGYIDEYGDYNGDKPRNRYDYTVSGEAEIRSDYLTDVALARLDRLYADLKARGVQPFVGYAAVNVSALEASDSEQGTHYLDEEALRFQERMEKIRNAPVIEELAQAYYTGSWFFNTDWHLSDEGAAKNTEVLIACLKTYLGWTK